MLSSVFTWRPPNAYSLPPITAAVTTDRGVGMAALVTHTSPGVYTSLVLSALAPSL